jgi:preprotein translocase subunit YajC
MKLISDAMAQTEQPAPSAAEPAPAPAAPSAAPAETAVAPAAPAAPPAKAESTTTPSAPATPAAPPTKTGTVAPNAPPPGQSEMPSIADLFAQIVPFLVIIGIVYIIVIRPQQRKQKEADAQLRNVRRGDVVVVNGFIGRVTKVVDDAEFEFEPGPNLRLRALLSSISEVRSRGEPIKDTPPPAKPAKDAAPAAKPAKDPAQAVKPAKDAPTAAKAAKDAPPAKS